MLTYRTHQRRSKSPLLASLLLHLTILFLLLTQALILPPSQPHDAFNPQMQPTQQENEPWATTLTEPEWAEQIAGASQFGTPIMLEDDPQLFTPEEKMERADPVIDESEATQPLQETEATPHTAIEQPEPIIAEPLELIQEVKQLEKEQREQRKKVREQQKAHEQKLAKSPSLELPKVTLADITRGMINQMSHGGNALVNSQGKRGAQASAEQIQYQRFMQKIHWCIQNSFNINRSRLTLTSPAHGVIKMGLVLERSGKLLELQVLQSCGNKAVDDFMHYIFKEAGDSFPPVPKYITGDRCPFVYHIDVNADPSQGSHMMMSVM